MEKMIGIITFHDTTNFGSALQSYALCKAIRNLGYNAEIVDYQCSAISNREHVKTAYSGIKGVARYVFFGHKNQQKHSALINFLQAESMVSQKRYSRDNISESNLNYDCFMSGSDIIWGVDITECDMSYFLDFAAPEKKRVAFASSIGDRWDPRFDNTIGNLLQKYAAIYVREENAVEIVKQVSGKDSKVVCDPTMLISPDYWDRLAKAPKYRKKYVLVYFGCELLMKKAKEYAQENDCQVLVINYGIPQKGVKNIRPVTVNDFLGLIKNALCVFTGSYHGMLFSLYFRKQFAVYNRAHTSRMNTVLNDLGLLECILTDNASDAQLIDYGVVFPQIERKRTAALQLLESMLR